VIFSGFGAVGGALLGYGAFKAAKTAFREARELQPSQIGSSAMFGVCFGAIISGISLSGSAIAWKREITVKELITEMEKQIRLSDKLDNNVRKFVHNVKEKLKKNLETAAETLNVEGINDNNLIHAKYYEEMKAYCDKLEKVKEKIEKNS